LKLLDQAPPQFRREENLFGIIMANRNYIKGKELEDAVKCIEEKQVCLEG